MLLTCSMESLLGLLLGLILVVASSAQNTCTCVTNKWAACAQDDSENCTCTLVGSNHKVDCSILTSKCLLMKAEMTTLKERHSWGHAHGLLDNGAIYNPDCEDSGIFKARQCNQTNTCWCVNSAGVRRTEKGDKSLMCSELVRTSWIHVELVHKKRSHTFDVSNVANALKQLFESRYKLHPKYIADIKYNSPLIQIHLSQNEKTRCDVDIVDAVYYFEKDIKDDSVFNSNSKLTVSVNGDALHIEKLWIYYVDEKPPEFSMKQLTAGISTVVTVVMLAAGFGVTMLVVLKCLWTRKYGKVEIEESGEITTPSLELP